MSSDTGIYGVVIECLKRIGLTEAMRKGNLTLHDIQVDDGVDMFDPDRNLVYDSPEKCPDCEVVKPIRLEFRVKRSPLGSGNRFTLLLPMDAFKNQNRIQNALMQPPEIMQLSTPHEKAQVLPPEVAQEAWCAIKETGLANAFVCGHIFWRYDPRDLAGNRYLIQLCLSSKQEENACTVIASEPFHNSPDNRIVKDDLIAMIQNSRIEIGNHVAYWEEQENFIKASEAAREAHYAKDELAGMF